ncbi:unnamed protein product [Moneuplotes crassus]|uniref:Uncharacterized protein n=1 Tax=Euplotes crassus TaxID=5936 RepID=A0AAD1X8D0_EUPCR|nr:unnamed protein product [Moneuplotes crassus]
MNKLQSRNRSARKNQYFNDIPTLSKCYASKHFNRELIDNNSPYEREKVKRSHNISTSISRSPLSPLTRTQYNSEREQKKSMVKNESEIFGEKSLEIHQHKKTSEDGIQKLENRIQKLIREEQKIRSKMEQTRKLGVKLADVMDFKMLHKKQKIQNQNKKEKLLQSNRRRISNLRKQISKNIESQKKKVWLQKKFDKVQIDRTFEQKKLERELSNAFDSSRRNVSLIKSQKRRRNSIRNHEVKMQRTLARNRYLGRMKREEREANKNYERMKSLEKLEEQAISNLKNTTLQHEFVQNKFRFAFCTSTNTLLNFGASSHKSFKDLEAFGQENTSAQNQAISTKPPNQPLTQKANDPDREPTKPTQRPDIDKDLQTKMNGEWKPVALNLTSHEPPKTDKKEWNF